MAIKFKKWKMRRNEKIINSKKMLFVRSFNY